MSLNFHISRIEFCSDFVLVPLAILTLSIWTEWSGVASIATIGGYVAWTFIEYAVHRFLFHRGPLLRYHMMHHRDPEALIGVSVIYTGLAIAALLAIGYAWHSVAPIELGFVAGYFWYICFHWKMHHGALNSARLRKIAEEHSAHHRKANSNFGVTTRAWDRVFGTVAPRPPPLNIEGT